MRIELPVTINNENLKEDEERLQVLHNDLADTWELISSVQDSTANVLRYLGRSDMFSTKNTELVSAFNICKEVWESILDDIAIYHETVDELNDTSKPFTDDMRIDITRTINLLNKSMRVPQYEVMHISYVFEKSDPSACAIDCSGYVDILNMLSDDIIKVTNRNLYSDNLTREYIVNCIDNLVDGYYNLSLLTSMTHSRIRSLGLTDADVLQLVCKLEESRKVMKTLFHDLHTMIE